MNEKKNPLHIGLRTIKTALSVAICIILFEVLQRGSPLFATLTAVFTLRNDPKTSLQFGITRVFGNIFGGMLAIGALALKMQFQLGFIGDLMFGTVGIIVIILFSNWYNPQGIVNAAATFFVIYFNVEASENLSYATDRVLDTCIGAIIAILVNMALPSPHLKQVDESKNDT